MKYRFALIGCGRISHKHIEGFVEDGSRIDLAAVCDLIPSRAEEKAKEYFDATGVSPKVYTDYRKMIEEVEPDAVTIATESGYHAAVALDCLEAGCHAIVEKPMALSTQDADKMIAKARAKGLKLAVCYQNRFNPPILRVYEAYRAGRFGRMLHGAIQIRWNRNKDYYEQAPWRGTWELDGGTLMNQCTHGIDLVQWLMGGDVVRVQGSIRKYVRPIEAEDFGAAILEFKSGAVGIIEGSADVYPKNLNETLSLFGEKGTAVVGGLAVNKLETWRFSDAAEKGDTEDKVLEPGAKDPPSVYGFGHSALFADFVDALEHDREPFVNGEEGRKSLEVVLAVYLSAKEGKAAELPVRFDTMQMKGTFK